MRGVKAAEGRSVHAVINFVLLSPRLSTLKTNLLGATATPACGGGICRNKKVRSPTEISTSRTVEPVLGSATNPRRSLPVNCNQGALKEIDGAHDAGCMTAGSRNSPPAAANSVRAMRSVT